MSKYQYQIFYFIKTNNLTLIFRCLRKKKNYLYSNLNHIQTLSKKQMLINL